MGQTYNYDYDEVINKINSNTSIRSTSEELEKFGMGVVEMSRNFQGAVAGVGIDKLYNDMRDDIQTAYNCVKDIDGIFDVVLNEAKNNKAIAEQPDPTPAASETPSYSTPSYTSSTPAYTPPARNYSAYSSNAGR